MKFLSAYYRRCFGAVIRVLRRIEEEERLLRSNELLARAKRCGKGTRIWGRASISGVEYAEFGTNVHIGSGAFIRAEGGLFIGDNTHISRNLVLYTINHQYEGTRLPYDEDIVQRSVHIGRNVWIGMNVCIAPGTQIGEGVIVGMGTVVSGTVPPFSIIGSQKWRLLNNRNTDHYHRLEKLRQYGGASGRLFWPEEVSRKTNER